MIKDFILSFKDNISQKAKNPFLGIYVIIWSIRNWELVYSVFNFDDDIKRENKITFIKNYFKEKPFIENILWNILISTGVLFSTYMLLNLSRLIVNFYDKIVSPWIYKITDKSSIVLKTDYKILENRNDFLEKKIENLKKEKNELQTDNDKVDKKNNELTLKIDDLEMENHQLKDIAKQSPNKIDKYEKQIKKQNELIKDYQTQISDFEGKIKYLKDLNPEVPYSNRLAYHNLKKEELIEEYIKTSVNILKNQSLNQNDPSIDFFINLNLIEFIENDKRALIPKNTGIYKLTTKGREVFDLINSEKHQ